MKMSQGSIVSRILLNLLIGVGAVTSACGQGEMATATMSGAPNGSGAYDYTLLLNNTGPTDIGTFWYAWIPGQFYLPTSPSAIGAPGGWAANVVGNYSIEFTAGSGFALGSGSSLNFNFTSADTPATLAGNAPSHPGTPIGTSYVYQGAAFAAGDPGYEFVVQSVPEPSALGLLSAGLLGLMWVRRRELRRLAGRWWLALKP